MKMNEFIAQLKQQPKICGVPPRNQQFSLPPIQQPAAQTAAQTVASTQRDQVNQLAQQLANQMVAEMQQSQILARNGRTYTKFDTVNDIIANQNRRASVYNDTQNVHNSEINTSVINIASSLVNNKSASSDMFNIDEELKKYYPEYENHKEQIKQRNKEYAEKVNYYAKISPEKKKQYARTAYLNHKEKVRKAKELDVGAAELVAGYV